jgi:quinol-cytochrome oxidoreductase complex cytochrome b subunit
MSAPQWNNKVVKWFDDRLPVISMLHHSAYEYPTPKNLSYMWNFGSLAGFVLVTMILTGIFLVMNYTPHTDMAFESVERIMRDVNYGWLIRYIHMNGASMFFIVVFIHIFRGLYYGSYKAPREVLWWIGILILGDPLVTWLWGGFSVDNPTLNRFFSLHYLMPFVILGLVVLHVWALHSVRSNNPTGVEIKTPQDSIPFHPYYTIKDLYGLGVFLIFFSVFVFFAPDFLGHPDNYIPANPLVTPPHIVPEWYFLPFYAILRSIDFTIFGIPAKLLGVLAMFASIVILFVIPWLDTSKVRSSKFRPVYKWFFWLFVIDTFILGYCGAKAPDDYFLGIPGLKVIVMGQLSTLYYFVHFLVVMPLVGKLERTKPLPASISESVLKEGANA